MARWVVGRGGPRDGSADGWQAGDDGGHGSQTVK